MPAPPSLSRRHLVAAAPLAVAAVALPATSASAAATGSLELVTPFRVLDSREDEPDKYDTTANDAIAIDGIAGKIGVLLNVTVVQTEGNGFFRVGGEAEVPPTTSTINWYTDGQIVANMAIVSLPAAAGGVVIQGGGSGRAHLVLDVLGFVSP